MLFNSWQFLIFLTITFFLYFLIPKKYRHIFLLIASYAFYMFWNYKLIFLILFTTLISYGGALLINKYKEKKKLKTFLMISSVTLCLLVLLFFKYFNFLANTVIDIINALFVNSYDYIVLNIILPVGISFYTFQTLSYVIDVYKEKYEPEKNFFYFALYVSFFPQLVAGPIERSNNLIPQFKEKEGIKKENISTGLKYMLKGYVEKIMIADMVGLFVNPIFNDINNANGLLVLIGSILFSVQILGDFAGYSNIAIGVAKLFNINLTKNFDAPYKATSIKEFWRRWHISLSNWFKDYLYIPLGGSHVSVFRWAVNILVVFIVSGLWHGAGYMFLIWGLLHGIYQIVGKLTLNTRDKLNNKIGLSPKSVNILRVVITYLLICFAWISFRSNNITDMLEAYRLLFTSWSFKREYFIQVSSILDLNLVNTLLLICPIVIYLFLDKLIFNIKNRYISYTIYVILAWGVISAYIYLSYLGSSSSFIYFQF